MVKYIIHIKLKRHRFIKTCLNLLVLQSVIQSHALSVLMDGLTYLVIDFVVNWYDHSRFLTIISYLCLVLSL